MLPAGIERLGVEVEFVTPTFDLVQAGGWNGQWDVSVGSITITEARKENLDFTEPYVLAMANAGTQGGRGTNGSQFFITVGPTNWLQGKHTIFGKVTDAASKAVVDKLASVPTDGRDRPLDDVVIEKITVEQL